MILHPKIQRGGGRMCSDTVTVTQHRTEGYSTLFSLSRKPEQRWSRYQAGRKNMQHAAKPERKEARRAGPEVETHPKSAPTDLLVLDERKVP